MNNINKYYKKLLDEANNELISLLKNNGLQYPDWLIKRAYCEYPRYYETFYILNEIKVPDREKTRILDVGGNFGLIAIILTKMGFNVHIIDNFDLYENETFNFLKNVLGEKYNITVNSLDLMSSDLHFPWENNYFHFALFLAVIEHLPNTSRYILKEINRVLKDSGGLIIDTPNAGYLESRLSYLRQGENTFSTIEEFFNSEIPFVEHIRCYSMKELIYILEFSGFKILSKKQFDLIRYEDQDSKSNFKKKIYNVLYYSTYKLLYPFFPNLRGYNWVQSVKLNKSAVKKSFW